MKAIVIGAGFAGLAAALRLRKMGLEVLVLEKALEPGGKAVGWEGIPTGPTVLTLPEIPRMIFEAFEAPVPDFQAVSPFTRYTWPDGKQFAPTLDLEQTLAQLEPQEASDYRRLLQEAKTIFEGARDTFIFGDPPTTLELGSYALRAGFKAHPTLTLEQLVQSGPHLTPFFLRFATYLGANPYKAPAVLHNVAWAELGLGVYHLPGGMRALVDRLYELAKAQGVTFEFDQTVLKILPDFDRVTAVQTDKGWFSADLYVSAADRGFTLELLGWQKPEHEMGVSGFAVSMHLNESVPLGHHVFFSPDYRLEWSQIESGQLPQDPTLYLHTEGQSAFLLVNAPNLQKLKTYSDADIQSYAQALLSKLQTLHPLSIASSKVLSPREFATTSYHGALYGNAPHGLLGSLRPGWKMGNLKNLVQVGGTVHPGGGVPLSMLSGWNGAGWLVEKVPKTAGEG